MIDFFNENMELVMGGVVILAIAVVLYLQNCAYRNGVNDGYGYAKEPTNPGYQAAGNYLKEVMAHRWPELREPNPTSAAFDSEAVSDFFDARNVEPMADGPDQERQQH